MGAVLFFSPLHGEAPEDSACNQMIIDSLEQAAVLNPGLPLPVDAYREICSLADREPSIKEDAPKMESDYPVGFRKRGGNPLFWNAPSYTAGAVKI